MAWTSLTFSFGSVLTSTKMTQMQDNFTALAQGLSGAPTILNAALGVDSVQAAQIQAGAVGQDEIGAGAVGQGELKTTTGTFGPGVGYAMGSVSRIWYQSPVAAYLAPGGSYGFAPTVQFGGAASVDTPEIMFGVGYYAAGATGALSDSAYWALYVGQVGSSDGSWGPTCTQRYMTASPPYDHGDGEIHQFSFLKLDISGNIIGVWSATEAPWHYNGPTDIRAERIDPATGRKYRRSSSLIAEFGSLRAARLAITRNALSFAEYRQRVGQAIDIEITQEIKRADMVLIPHPFGPLKPGERVVMLDPVSPLMADIAEHQACGECLADLLREGYIQFDNVALPRSAMPPGVMVVGCRWRLTG